MSNIAIITARGGSKRIPRKNIRDFLGKPIIAYSITSAIESGIFDEVMVSTDDEEIADISRKYGASIPFMRSEETANDYATTTDVLKEVLNCYKNLGRSFSSMCCLYPCAPFVTKEKLIDAYELLIKTNSSFVLPVVKFNVPIQWALKIVDTKAVFNTPEYRSCRSQDLEDYYFDAGQFYFYKLENEVEFNSEEMTPIIIPESEVQDIDTLEDWRIAEQKYIYVIKSELKKL